MNKGTFQIEKKCTKIPYIFSPIVTCFGIDLSYTFMVFFYIHSSKFSSKLRYIKNLDALTKAVPTEYIYIPDEVKK